MAESRELTALSQAAKQLSICVTIDAAKDIRDKAEAVRIYLREVGDGVASQNWAAEIVVMAERRAGEILARMDKSKGTRCVGKVIGGTNVVPPIKGSSLAEIGVTKKQSSRWQTIARLPKRRFDEIVVKEKASGKPFTSGKIYSTIKRIERTAKLEQALKDATDNAGTMPTIEFADAIEWLKSQSECDLILTDPPYSTDVENIDEFAAAWLPLALSKLKPTGRAYVFIGAYPKEIAAYCAVAMPSQILVWTYKNTLGPSPRNGYKLNWQAILYFAGEDAPPLNSPVMIEQFSVQEINAPDGRLGDRYHAWQKPLTIAERFVRHSTEPGGTVLDPFACTGTFLLAAATLGRIAKGCDISEENIKIAIKRGCSRE